MSIKYWSIVYFFVLVLILLIIIIVSLGKYSNTVYQEPVEVIGRDKFNYNPTPILTLTPTPTPASADPCVSEDTLSVFVGEPFNNKSYQEAENYFNTNQLKIVLRPQTSQEFVIQLLSKDQSDYWINKFKRDGFGDIKYWRMVGCDVAN